MAKQKVNKSQAIRDARAASPDKTPSEIAAELQSKGIKVSAQYVSTISSNDNAKARRGRSRGRGRGRGAADGIMAMSAAVSLVKAAGGLEQAKAALDTVREIAISVRSR